MPTQNRGQTVNARLFHPTVLVVLLLLGGCSGTEMPTEPISIRPAVPSPATPHPTTSVARSPIAQQSSPDDATLAREYLSEWDAVERKAKLTSHPITYRKTKHEAIVKRIIEAHPGVTVDRIEHAVKAAVAARETERQRQEYAEAQAVLAASQRAAISSGSSGSSGGKTEHVSGYTRKDGTQVRSYNRRSSH
jgi:hypothetical protein